MSDLRLSLPDPEVAYAPAQRIPLGRHLVNKGIIAQDDLVHALALQRHVDAPLGEVLIAEGLATPDDVLNALAQQFRARRVDLDNAPPEPWIADALPASLCLKFNVVPWLQLGDVLMVATSRPDQFDRLQAALGPRGSQLLPVISSHSQVLAHQSRLYGAALALQAEVCVPVTESCRNWGATRGRSVWVGVAAAVLGLCLLVVPLWTITLAMLWATLTLVMTTTLKTAAFCAQLAHKLPDTPQPFTTAASPFRLPRVSVLVPLLHEEEIAGALIARLSQLTYPKSLLNVVLVLEAGDQVTRQTLARTDLPPWVSVVEVPQTEGPRTKPRALNYALNFCNGSIIGVWDAEDWPEPDQIERVVTRFSRAPANVACLQGILDYYNARTNWLSRCFTIEYATWWRLVLPGIARLGLVIPLGGTTLFFRRDILEELGGWDAHNVTEDADLGVRLARHGYVTELLPTVTHEEATCRAWPWVRQRSRWLKGFMVTYLVHMRSPRRLWRDLGPMRFAGLQAIFLATVSQFVCAPLLWSFWLTLFGFDHPVAVTLGTGGAWAMAAVFMAAEALNLSMGLVAVSGPAHRHLMGWVITLPLYFTLGTIASYKALYELVQCPFFWDKTQHGVSAAKDQPSS